MELDFDDMSVQVKNPSHNVLVKELGLGRLGQWLERLKLPSISLLDY
jgi:hypothetical protein